MGIYVGTRTETRSKTTVHSTKPVLTNTKDREWRRTVGSILKDALAILRGALSNLATALGAVLIHALDGLGLARVRLDGDLRRQTEIRVRLT